MRLIDYMQGPMAGFILTALGVGLAIATFCGVLSPYVVLKRMSFVGQGVSHAAFGGIGVAAILGLADGPWYYAVVSAFCICAAMGIAWVSERRHEHEDTVIGVFLVGSMALGALLIHLRHRMSGGASMRLGWETLLFGSIVEVNRTDLVVSVVVLALIAGVLLACRRQMVFWAFDEAAAESMGVRTTLMRTCMMVLLGVAVLASMRLVGVVLATALLILPGASALQVSRRMGAVWMLSTIVSVLGVAVGFLVGVEADVPPGPAMVATLIVLYLVTWPARLRL